MQELSFAALTDHRFDAVLFDLDGTLIDSTGAVRRAWERWAQEEGLDRAAPAAYAGRPARDIVAALVPPRRAEQALRHYTAIAQSETDGVRGLPGADRALTSTNGRCAVVTASSGPVATARLRAAGLDVPEQMVTAEDVVHGKPAPDPYLLGAALLGVDASRCLAVEDSPVGLESARAAGCHALFLDPDPGDDTDREFRAASLADVEFSEIEGTILVSRPS